MKIRGVSVRSVQLSISVSLQESILNRHYET